MPAKFADGGVSFQYPENWQLEREDTDNGWTVSVQSPGAAFFMMTLRDDRPELGEVLEAALVALREVYPDLEAERKDEPLAGQQALGYDIEFISLDLTNTCWIRSFHAKDATLLVLCQANDLEFQPNGLVLKAMCASLQMESPARSLKGPPRSAPVRRSRSGARRPAKHATPTEDG